jgi:hypothetical protein
MNLKRVFIFDKYREMLPGVDPVFRSGELVLVTAVDDEGIYRCTAVSLICENSMERTDMVFAEELVPLNHPLLIMCGCRGDNR